MKFRDVINLLEGDGWRLVKQRGSHRQYKHVSKPGKVTIAGHPSAEAAPKTLRSILNTSRAETMNFAVIYEKTSTGYSAYVPDLPGCVAGGATLEETTGLIRGAIELHLETMRDDGNSIPEPTTIAGSVAVHA